MLAVTLVSCPRRSCQFSECAAKPGRLAVDFSWRAKRSVGCGQAQLAGPEQVPCEFIHLGAKGKPFPSEQLHSNSDDLRGSVDPPET